MIIEIPQAKREKIITLLSHWHAGRKSFTVLQAAQLLGTLEHITTVAPWLRYLFDCLRHSLIMALRFNTALVYKNKRLRDFFIDISFKGSSHDSILRKKFATGVIAKKIWHSKHAHFITKQLASELALLRDIFNNPLWFRLYTPISYLVNRTPGYVARGDACLDGAGGFSLDLQFWWFFEWPETIRNLTLKKFTTSVRIEQDKFISINLLEYLTIIISYAGAIQSLRDTKQEGSQQYPLLSIASDNTSAVAWTKKAILSNNIGKDLARFFCCLLSTNELGITTHHIAGTSNVTADKISRLSSSKFSVEFNSILQAHPELRSCRRFHPNPSLLCSLMQTLLQERTLPDALPERLGHFSLA